MKPPKCKACGKEEWRHTCSGADSGRVIKEARVGQPNDGRPAIGSGERNPSPDPSSRVRGNSKRGVDGTPIAPKPEIATGTDFPASSSGRTSRFGRENLRSNRGAGAKKAPVAQRKERKVPDLEADGSNPSGNAKFDRTAYQRDYMRDKRAADKLGITVKEYRKGKKP